MKTRIKRRKFPAKTGLHIRKAAAILCDCGATEVFLFGSAVKNALRPDSDIDFAVRGLPPGRYFDAMGKAQAVLGRTVDILDLDENGLVSGYLLRSGGLLRVA
jgi:predicted nucleotidyltransferase